MNFFCPFFLWRNKMCFFLVGFGGKQTPPPSHTALSGPLTYFCVRLPLPKWLNLCNWYFIRAEVLWGGGGLGKEASTHGLVEREKHYPRYLANQATSFLVIYPLSSINGNNNIYLTIIYNSSLSTQYMNCLGAEYDTMSIYAAIQEKTVKRPHVDCEHLDGEQYIKETKTSLKSL